MKVIIEKATIVGSDVVYANNDIVLRDVTLVNVVRNNKYIGITNKEHDCFDPVLCDITRFNVIIEND